MFVEHACASFGMDKPENKVSEGVCCHLCRLLPAVEGMEHVRPLLVLMTRFVMTSSLIVNYLMVSSIQLV